PFLLAQASADNAAGVFFGFGAFALILALALGLFWLWMLIDALTNASLEPPMKITWALVIFFLPFLGALAYFFMGRKGTSRTAI
ncbi:MAG: PLD nuclease N-terminal domain-containing protein, partial [Acidobacteriota bacterium]